MDEVDFGYIGREEATVYIRCFQRYLEARFILKRPEAEWKKLVSKTEAVFYSLIDEGNRRGFNVNTILEITSSTGDTCFRIASQCSRNISEYFIGKGLKVNSVTLDMLVADFEYPDLTIPMLSLIHI